MLKSVRIERFRNLRDITINFAGIDVLIGANSSGKSSVLEAIQFTTSIAQLITQKENTSWEDNKLTEIVCLDELLYIPQANPLALASDQGRISDGLESGISVTFVEDDESLCKFVINSSGKQDLLITITGEVMFTKMSKLAPPYTVIVPGLSGLLIKEQPLVQGIVRKSAIRGDGSSVFRNILLQLKESGAMPGFKDDLLKLFPGMGLQIEFDKEFGEHIDVFVIKPDDTVIPIDSIGTGVLQAIQILAYVHLYKPAIIMLDEPDAHLHPDNQMKIAQALLRIADDLQIQVLLATHSRYLLDHFKSMGHVHWLRAGELVECHDREMVELMLELGALGRGELLKEGKVKCIVLTEDSKIDHIKCLCKANGFNIEETEFWPFYGCGNIVAVQVMISFILAHSGAVKILVHRDRDYLKENEVQLFIDSVKNINSTVSCFVTKGTDVEAMFVKKEHVVQCCDSITSVDDASGVIQEALYEAEEKSFDIFYNASYDIAMRERRTTPESRFNAATFYKKCRQEYDENKEELFHGKSVYKRLKCAIQRKYGGDVNLIKPTLALKFECLEQFSENIWKES